MKKPVITTLVAALVMLVTGIAIGFVFNFIFPSLQDEYANQEIYRAWDDPSMYLFFFQPFIFTGMMVWGWNKTGHLFTGSLSRKAFQVALIMFLLAAIPGMLMTISTFKVSLLAVFTWTVSSFFQVWLAALVFIKMEPGR